MNFRLTHDYNVNIHHFPNNKRFHIAKFILEARKIQSQLGDSTTHAGLRAALIHRAIGAFTRVLGIH